MVNMQGLSQSAAIEKNKGLLQRNTYMYLQPEQMHSFEVGYRSILLNNRLFVDADLYYNFYSNFIAQIEASIPNTTDKKLGFNVTMKYQSNFYWQSFLINGNVPAVFNADAMLQYSFTNPSYNIKLGDYGYLCMVKPSHGFPVDVNET